jgi:hypothetical protein
MKATYTSQDGRLIFEIEAESPKAAFMKIATLQEIFEADNACGCCHSVNIHLKHRVTEEDYHYYELACDCGARLQFGQTKKGGLLFAKRRDDDGHDLPDRGWAVWKPQRETPAQPPMNSVPRTYQQAPSQVQPRSQRDQISDDDVPF